MSIQRATTPPPAHDYFWRSLGAEEWETLTKKPNEYGKDKTSLKELAKARRLGKQKCVQVSQYEEEARGWLRAGAVALIRIPLAKLTSADWEIAPDHHFPFVTGAAVVAHHEVVVHP